MSQKQRCSVAPFNKHLLPPAITGQDCSSNKNNKREMKNVPILVKLAFWGKRQKNVKLLSITHLPSRGDEGPGETTWHHSREDVGRGHGERGRHIKREARPDLDEKEERSEGSKRRSLIIAREGTAWQRGQQALPGVGCGQGRGQSSRAQSCKAPGCAGPSGRGLANSCTILMFFNQVYVHFLQNNNVKEICRAKANS